jgi:uncharacterized protein (TIGR02284 family)
MLRSELQVALNDVVVACLEAADGHERSADFELDPQLADLLRVLTEERRSLAEALGERLKATGDLPRAPDSDLEAVRGVVSRFKAALSADERRALLEERAVAEANLEEVAASALCRDDLPADARALVEQIRERARNARDRLTTLLAGQ